MSEVYSLGGCAGDDPPHQLALEAAIMKLTLRTEQQGFGVTTIQGSSAPISANINQRAFIKSACIMPQGSNYTAVLEVGVLVVRVKKIEVS